ncbi:MAG TPA: type II CAAX endopeptidase family protein [Casimicrobiaceae bacterium]|nr:type II CAAX endopeptidase family protein [Casimicrobiaceae bacterium]
MPALTRRPAFWIAYAGAAAVALVVAWRLFPLAIPLVELDVRLSREEAIAKAEAIATLTAIAPADARAAVRFAHDETTQNYVELEGGGKPAFAAIVAGDVYSPYRWEIRLFAPGETAEAVVRLRPDGAPIGFTRKVPETFVPQDPAALALTRAAAQALAERGARADWGVDLGAYRLLEATDETRATGRVDHAFVYEREGGHPGDARFRLRLAVAGDVLTEVAPFVFVPESFGRRFRELRSANNAIAGAAGIAAVLLYGVGGCVLGVLWLARGRRLLWRPAVAAGFAVGVLLGAASLADAPTEWFGYDTAQPVATFWLREAGKAAAMTFAGGLLLSLVFMAAESLSRRAFPSHPQLWRLWSRDAAPTRAVLGRTVGGYLFVPLALAFVAAFYYATNRWLGWWQPSEALTDPDILGSALPALSPIAMALEAGFMEECLFRAVPLSLAALVGQRLGHRTAAIGIAVIVQALVFAGAHANYPGFPAYSRLVELFLPSVVWALIFLRFGLLPTVLLHALFDLALMSLPLFLVSGPGAAASRALAIAAGFVPLGVVVARRLARGRWAELPDALRNGAWEPPTLAPPIPVTPPARTDGELSPWVLRFQRALPLLGAAGIVVWIAATPFRADVPPLALDRAQAEAIADAALRERGVARGPEWRRLSGVRLASDDAALWQGQVFAWREAGRAAYARLVGKTLPPPMWEVRYARFEGDVAARAEEWRVTVDGRGGVRQVRHTLPEAAPGARLSRDEAQALARRALRERFGLDPAALTEVGAEERQRQARADWTFTFAEPGVDVGKDGEARVAVSIAGDEVAAYGRYIKVPEDWQRAERERESGTLVLRMALAGVLGVAALVALVMAAIDWIHGRRDRRAQTGVALLVLVLGAATTANGWPQAALELRTTEPILWQAAQAMALAAVGVVVGALGLGLVAGVGAFAAERTPPRALATRLPPWAAGVAAAGFVAGAGALAAALVPRSAPLWPGLGVEALALPWLGAALTGARTLYGIVLALFLLHWTSRLTGGWQRRGWLVAAIAVALSATLALAGARDAPVAGVAGALSGAAVIGAVYGLLRFDALALPAFVATGLALDLAATALRKGYVAALADAAIAIAVAALVTWGVTRYLARARAAARGGGSVTES